MQKQKILQYILIVRVAPLILNFGAKDKNFLKTQHVMNNIIRLLFYIVDIFEINNNSYYLEKM